MIEIIAGTNRPGANALKLAGIIRGYYRDRGREANILSLSEMPQEIFLPSSYAQKPSSWKAISDRVLNADGLHVIVPEYNGSFPGVLKYFVDMLKFPESFERRCVCFTGEAAGIWGGFRAVEQIQMIFGYRDAVMLPDRVWIPGINQKWNAEGTGLAEEALVARLRDQVERFIDFVERNKGLAAKAAP